MGLAKKRSYRPLSCGGHFVSGDWKSFVHKQSFLNLLSQNGCRVTKVYRVQQASPRKQPAFGDTITGFPVKWRLRNERRNAILMTRHYPDLASASDWSCHVGNLFQPIRSTVQIWVVMRHLYGISRSSFGGETSGSITKCLLFSQASNKPDISRVEGRVFTLGVWFAMDRNV